MRGPRSSPDGGPEKGVFDCQPPGNPGSELFAVGQPVMRCQQHRHRDFGPLHRVVDALTAVDGCLQQADHRPALPGTRRPDEYYPARSQATVDLVEIVETTLLKLRGLDARASRQWFGPGTFGTNSGFLRPAQTARRPHPAHRHHRPLGQAVLLRRILPLFPHARCQGIGGLLQVDFRHSHLHVTNQPHHRRAQRHQYLCKPLRHRCSRAPIARVDHVDNRERRHGTASDQTNRYARFHAATSLIRAPGKTNAARRTA